MSSAYASTMPPGPRGLGYYKTLLGLGREFVQTTSTLFKRYGQVVGMYPPLGRHLRLVAIDPTCPGAVFAYGPEVNRTIATNSDVFFKNPLLGGVFPHGKLSERQRKLALWGTGLFNMNGDTHRQDRRLLLPGFHKTRLERYRDDIVRLTNQCLERWMLGEVVNMQQAMMKLTGQIVVTILFGSQASEHISATSSALHSFMLSMFSPSIRFFPMDIPGTAYHAMLNRVEAMDSDLRELIARKRTQSSGASDLLTMLLEARYEDGSPLSQDDLIQHVTVLFAAGHQTSSDALCWTLLLLAQHPQIAAALVDELQGKLKGDAPTLEQFNDLPLLDGVVKESLRLLPPAPINGRVLSQNFELCKHPIPAGTEVLFSILHTHHMPEAYGQTNQIPHM